MHLLHIAVTIHSELWGSGVGSHCWDISNLLVCAAEAVCSTKFMQSVSLNHSLTQPLLSLAKDYAWPNVPGPLKHTYRSISVLFPFVRRMLKLLHRSVLNSLNSNCSPLLPFASNGCRLYYLSSHGKIQEQHLPGEWRKLGCYWHSFPIHRKLFCQRKTFKEDKELTQEDQGIVQKV